MRRGIEFSLLLLAAALLAACSKNQSHAPDESTAGASNGAGGTDSVMVNDPTAVSGSRLRAQYLTTADGARQFHGWSDKNLGISCHFSTADDGKQRCLPDTLATVSGAFADMDCKAPLVQVAASCTDTPSYVLQTSAGTCGPTTQVYSVGAAQTPTQIYFASGTDCVGSDPPANQKFFALGAKADASAFLDGTSAGVPSGHRLDPVYTLGSDGSKERTGWFDTTQNSACAVSIAADGKSRCLPSPAAIVRDTFGDAGCTQPLAQSVAMAQCDAVGAPNLAFEIDTGACPATKALYAVTAAFQGAQVWVQRGTSCAPMAATGSTYYQVTAINPPEFELFLEVQSGSARLKPDALVDADGDSELGTELFDTTRGESCTFATAADGQIRCLPDGLASLFSDAQCMQAVGVAAQSGCKTTTPTCARLTHPDTCASNVSIFPLGAQTPSAALFGLDVTGRCSSAPAPSATLYSLGAEVAASEFAPATLSTE